ncbi:MAG TPA: ABC transporter ATP-binding protein [Syntrophorhabdaceae bacterium]|nr:ABC transporter ATP-binding protein [Syntrophorhabdaceae bacterium]HPU30964.1 ABC transporter ATP-binding protein [Syntrophorhabdaceae bacterium]
MNDIILKVSNITKIFKKDSNEINVIKGISLDILQGDFVTIMGPSGAGKSTFLHILGTLDKPTSGEIFYRGENISKYNEEQASNFRSEKIGFVFQFYHLLQDFTVIENIAMPLFIKRVKMDKALKKAEIFLEMMGLKDRRNHKPGELSGGEQQRVAIARALINEPEIILADEPTGNLDRKTGKDVLNYILNIYNEFSATLILVTHDPELGSMGKRRLNMIDGELFEIKN